jgi:spermidine/putrescine-binding protein
MKQSKQTRRAFNLVAFAGVVALAGAGGIVAAQAQQKGRGPWLRCVRSIIRSQ